MPRNVRNFWLTLTVDGRKPLCAGPVSRDGGFDLHMQIRDQGAVRDAGYIRGRVVNGKLVILYEGTYGERQNLCVTSRDPEEVPQDV